MVIVVTDSGFGGLSIAAEVYEWLKDQSFSVPIEIKYVNALPDTGKGYNTISDNLAKIHNFNRLLDSIEALFQPDIVVIACNTLSVLVSQTAYHFENRQKILDILDSGTTSVLSLLEHTNDNSLIIFGTETTINSGFHWNYFLENKYCISRVIAQSCPGLASKIENNPNSAATLNIIRQSVQAALQNLLPTEDTNIYAILACTHYSYVADHFKNEFLSNRINNIQIIDPNINLISDIKSHLTKYVKHDDSLKRGIKLEVISKVRIPDRELRSIIDLLKFKSADTVQALVNYQHIPDLF
jgi:glutamate racemase